MTKTIHRYLRLINWKVIHSLPQKNIIINSDNGIFAINNKDWLIGKQLYVNRAFEIIEMDRAIANLRMTGWLPTGRSTLIDAGANIGMISIAMLRREYFQHAIAFEPTPSTYKLLVENVQRNGLHEAIHCVPMALLTSSPS